MTEIVEHSAEKIARSTATLSDSSARQATSAEIQVQLAATRTALAAERTYAAWMRTGLSALGFGIGAKALLTGVIVEWLVSTTGSVIVFFSALCFAAAVWREMSPGLPPPLPTVRRIPVPLLVVVNGFLILLSLTALVGIWLVRVR